MTATHTLLALSSLALLSACGSSEAAGSIPHDEFEALPPELVEQVVSLRERAPKESKAYELLEKLTAIGPRFTGTANERKAIAWAVKELEDLGFSNVRAEEVVVPVWERGEAAGEVTSPTPAPFLPFALGGSCPTPSGGLEAEVLRVQDLAELATLDRALVEGRIVFLAQRMPRTKDGRGYGEVSPIRRAGPARAAEKGAIAVLIRSVTTSSADVPTTGMTHYEEGVPKIPAASLSNPEADRLEALLEEHESVRFRLRLDCRYTGEAKSANVIGEIPGREFPDEVVLLAAHLDSWDVGTGALDDGVGCAIMMDVARQLGRLEPRPRRTIRVWFVANEEFGLEGALAYDDRYASAIDEHVLCVESDFGADPVWLMNSRVSRRGLPAIRDLARLLEPLGIEYGTNETLGGADFLPMLRHRLPVLEMRHDGTRYFDHYHSANDTLDKVDRESLARNVAAYAVVALVAAEVEGGFGRPPKLRFRLPPPFDRAMEGESIYR